MIDFDKLKTDLEEVSRAAQNGHLTRRELLSLRLDLAWTLQAVGDAVKHRRHPEEPRVNPRFQQGGFIRSVEPRGQDAS